jgi:hypothetical protein
MRRVYLPVISGSVLEAEIRTQAEVGPDPDSDAPGPEAIADFLVEDWRRMRDEKPRPNVIMTLWPQGRVIDVRELGLPFRPMDLKNEVKYEVVTPPRCERDEQCVLIHGRPKGSFQDVVARFLAILMFNLRQRLGASRYEYSFVIRDVFHRQLVEGEDGSFDGVQKTAQRRMTKQAQKWRQGEEARGLMCRLDEERRCRELIGLQLEPWPIMPH